MRGGGILGPGPEPKFPDEIPGEILKNGPNFYLFPQNPNSSTLS